MRDRVALTPPDAPVNVRAVSPSTYDHLLELVAPHGWTPMLSETEDSWRAWIRHTDGRRMFGRPAPTAEAAAQAMIAKVAPLAVRR